MNASPKILVVGPSWVGDMVMAQSLFMALKQQFPDCTIDVLAPDWTFALLQRMPEVRQAVSMPLGHGQFDFKMRRRLGQQMQSEHYDRAILLTNTWKSALAPYFAKIPLRTGFVGEMRWGLLNDARKLDKQLLTKTVQRFVALAPLQPVDAVPDTPQPRLAVDLDSVEAVREKFNLQNVSRPVLGLCPGAEYGPAKRWPQSYYAELANKHLQRGGAVFLFGSGKDTNVAAEINRLCQQRCHDFTGQTSMTEAIDLMSLADVVVSNDSGLMHVAAALDKKLVALYGSSDPGFTPPLHPDAKIIYLGLECSPCFERECPLEHLNCLRNITPERVSEAVCDLLQ